MRFLKLIPILLIFFGNFPYKNLVHAEVKNPKDYKVLSNDNKKLSISNVEYYLTQGDKFIKNGVLIKKPATCYFSYNTKIEKKVIIEPNVTISNNVCTIANPEKIAPATK